MTIISKNWLRKIAKNKGFSIRKEAIDELIKKIQVITEGIIIDAIRNAKLSGRKRIKRDDFV